MQARTAVLFKTDSGEKLPLEKEGKIQADLKDRVRRLSYITHDFRITQ